MDGEGTKEEGTSETDLAGRRSYGTCLPTQYPREPQFLILTGILGTLCEDRGRAPGGLMFARFRRLGRMGAKHTSRVTTI
jgi:hypothetical protein